MNHDATHSQCWTCKFTIWLYKLYRRGPKTQETGGFSIAIGPLCCSGAEELFFFLLWLNYESTNINPKFFDSCVGFFHPKFCVDSNSTLILVRGIFLLVKGSLNICISFDESKSSMVEPCSTSWLATTLTILVASFLFVRKN